MTTHTQLNSHPPSSRQQPQEYEFVVDAGQGELGCLPAPVEVGRKIRIFAHVDGEEVVGAADNAVEIGKEGGDLYPVKEWVKGANELRMCIKAELGGSDGGGGVTKKRCLVELTWNASEKVLHIYPDFNRLSDDPYFIEFDHPNGQMLIYGISTIQEKKKIKNEHQEKRDLQQITKIQPQNHSFDLFEAPPDRNHFLSLLLFTFQTASGFDYDRLHFKYTVSHVPSRTISHGSTQTTSKVKDFHHVSHVFEMEFKIPYQEEMEAVDILLEAFSVDLWNRERFHGFCKFKIPPTIPGHFKRELHFVREIGTFRESLERFFIGGHRLRSGRGTELHLNNNNFYGQNIKSNGLVQINYNVIVQRNITRMAIKDAAGLDDGPGALDVDAVINGFKKCCLLAEKEDNSK